MLNKKIIPLMLAAVLGGTAFLMPANVQAAVVQQQYINNNRSHQALNPIGLVIHDTDNEGATAQNNRDYFNRVYVAASAHYFVDWNTDIETIPENEVAWHAGPTANHRYLSIEMCMPYGHDTDKFNKVYENTVQLAADMCKRYGWSTQDIRSHYWVSETFHETDHEDPIAYLGEYGKSWDMLLNDIQKTINGQSVSVAVAPMAQSATVNSLVGTLQAEINRQALGNLVADGIPGPKTLAACPLLKQGTKGNITKWVQERLGITADGDFGPITRTAVINFQKAHGLTPDGVIGQNTWKALLGL
ncbi:MAG: N-acetylmuramoyl-L-alanine amidase [Bacillota bacterium]|nr:N-acetylmuramoyl-L-alanine amidase [Bacillota bacterium]